MCTIICLSFFFFNNCPHALSWCQTSRHHNVSPCHFALPAPLKRLRPNSAQEPPAYTHEASRTMTLIDIRVVFSEHRAPTQPEETTQSPHKGHSWHGDARPMSPTSCRVRLGRRLLRKIAAHQNAASDLNTFTDTFPVRMNFVIFLSAVTCRTYTSATCDSCSRPCISEKVPRGQRAPLDHFRLLLIDRSAESVESPLPVRGGTWRRSREHQSPSHSADSSRYSYRGSLR